MAPGRRRAAIGGGGGGLASRQIATFHLDELYLGIDVAVVQEVLRVQPLTRVPLAPSAVEGLLNLRGQIVTAIDLRRRLGMAARPAGHAPMHVVVRTADGVVSLIVDEMDDVVELPDARLAPTPATLERPARDVVLGVYALEDRLLLLLDQECAAAVSDRDAQRSH